MKTITLISMVTLLAGVSSRASDLSPDERNQIEQDWFRQETVTREKDAASQAAVDGVLSRGRLLCDDLAKLGAEAGAQKARRELDAVQANRDRLLASGNGVADAWKALYLRARWALRDLAFCNPRLDFDRLLFVKRQWPQIGHQAGHRIGESQTPGANLCILVGLRPSGELRELLTGEYAKGGIGRPDLSYDGRRIVFPFARPRDKPTPWRWNGSNWFPGYSPKNPIADDRNRDGLCEMYDIFEIGVDGTGLRRLTPRDRDAETEPFYMPNGRIGFMSSRQNRQVDCGQWADAFGIYSMQADGSDVRRITEPQEGEFYPSMLDDGRILYTRWDYVMKPYNLIQQLWTVCPDGRQSELAYGDWYAFSPGGPIAMFEARQIPGTNKVIATGAAHHNTGVGPIMIADLAQNRGDERSMVNVTPEIAWFGDGGPPSKTGWYSSPYPLSEKHFLVCYSFDPSCAKPDGWGIYLQDVHGNKELVFRGQGYSCYSPIPVRPRPTPAVIPDLVSGVASATPGWMVLQDVYEGLDGIPRGTIKHLRILEVYPRGRYTNPGTCDAGFGSGYDFRGVLGTVPVEPDGSAYFEVPSGKLIFFEALDQDYLEIRRMRNYVNVMPGETRACVGCHESPRRVPPVPPGGWLAMRRGPTPIEPPPWGAGPMNFAEIVQPVLDRNCVKCHDGSAGKDKSFDLGGRRRLPVCPNYWPDLGQGARVSESYLSLTPYVSYPKPTGYGGGVLPLKPLEYGSKVSPLMLLLAKGHGDVKLPIADWRALAAWIDCNAPFLGDIDKVDEVYNSRLITEVERTQIRERIDELAKELGPAGGRVVTYHAAGLMTGPGQPGQDQGVVVTPSWYFAMCWPDMLRIPELRPTQKILGWNEGGIEFRVKGLDPARRYSLCWTWWGYDNVGVEQSVQSYVESHKDKAVTLLEKARPPAWAEKKELPVRVTMALPAEQVQDGRGSLVILLSKQAGPRCVFGEMWLVEHEAGKVVTELHQTRN